MLTRHSSHGFVLLLVIGILTLLAMLAVAFTGTAQLERSVGRNYLDQIRAQLAAESGVEHAISRLQSANFIPADMNAMQFHTANPALPLTAAAAIPSFAADIDGDGALDPWSGSIGGTYTSLGDRFKLRVADESGKLNLNDSNGAWNLDTDPLPDDPGTDRDLQNAPGRLWKLVSGLGAALVPAGGTPLGDAMADAVFSARKTLPGERFGSLEDVRAALQPLVDTGQLTIDDRARFLDQVTLWSWQDSQVLRPTFQLAITNPDSGYQFPHRGFDIYLGRDMQTTGYVVEPRCPVNLNTASVELLTALLAPVQGWFLREGPGERMSNGRYGAYCNVPLAFDHTDETRAGGYVGFFESTGYGYGCPIGKMNSMGRACLTPPVHDASGLAAALHARIHDPADPRPFTTWDELRHFLLREADPHLLLDGADLAAIFDDTAEGRRDLRNVLSATNSQGGTVAHRVTDTFELNFSAGSPAALPTTERWWAELVLQAQVDALLANFNPNAQLNDMTPNRNLYRVVDKAQLTQYTAEFCFEPSGIYAVESYGVVHENSGRVVARARVETVLQIDMLLRQTSQRDFMRGIDARRPNTQFAGMGAAAGAAWFEAARGLGAAGQDATANGDRLQGATLQSYPEPFRYAPRIVNYAIPLGRAPVPGSSAVALPLTPGAPAADEAFSAYEGYLQLATRQDGDRREWRFRHHFNGSLAADPAHCANNRNGLFITGDESMPPVKRNTPTEAALTPALASRPRYPGSLYVDGGYSEAGRTLSFPIINLGSAMDIGILGYNPFDPRVNQNNTAMPAPMPNGRPMGNGSFGSLDFWVKPAMHTGISRVTNLLRAYADNSPNPTPPTAILPLVAANNHVRQFSLNYFSHQLPYAPAAGDGVGIWGTYIDTSLTNLAGFHNWAGGWNKEAWIEPNAFCFGWGGLRDPIIHPGYFNRTTAETQRKNMVGIATGRACESTPEGATANFHFEGRCWNHLAISWNINPPVPPRGSRLRYDPSDVIGQLIQDPTLISAALPFPLSYKLAMAVNGEQIPEAIPQALNTPGAGNGGQHRYEFPFDLHNQPGINQYVRLGEVLAGGDQFGHREAYSADSVYDELYSYNTIIPASTLANHWKTGRFYNTSPNDARYTSAELDPWRELGVAGGLLRLRRVCATVYWPSNNRLKNRVTDNFPGMDVSPFSADPMDRHWYGGNGAASGWDPVSFDFATGAAGQSAEFLFETAAGDIDSGKKYMPAACGGSNIAACMTPLDPNRVAAFSLNPGQTVRYRIYWNYQPDVMPFYESPVVDDVTLRFTRVRPVILYWRGVAD